MSMETIALGIIISNKLRHWMKAWSPMVATKFGILISAKFVQLEKAPVPIEVSEVLVSQLLISVIFLHSSKA
jgi:hypothetical protein